MFLAPASVTYLAQLILTAPPCWEGDQVCALLVHSGYSTHVVRGAEHWVKVPDGLDDVLVVALILNYGTAYQMIHRVARLAPGQSALVNAANGGVG